MSDREDRLSIEQKGWARLVESRVSRRTLIRGGALGAAGLTAAALIGCGDDDDDDGGAAAPATAAPTQAAAPATAAAATAAATAAAEPDYVRLAREDGAAYPYSYEEPDTPPKPGGILRLAVQWGLGTWDPNFPSGGHGQNVANVAANRLLGLVDGPEMSKFEIGIEPELAKTWEVSPDGLTYTFHLNEGVRFHNIAPVNGRELVAQDVKLAYDRAATEGINQAFFDFLNGIAVPDDRTVEITLHTPDADFLIPIASRQLPIYAPELYEGDLFETLAIGSGAGILKDFKDGQGITIDANPDYWEGKPWLDGMEWIISPDAATRTAEFRVGRFDWGAAASTPEAVEALRETNPDIQVTSDPIVAATLLLALNTAQPALADERVRQAMSLSIDRDRFVQILYQGYGKVVPGFGWPFLFDEEPKGEELGRWWRYDPAEATKLVEAAGATGTEFDLIFSNAYLRTLSQASNGLFGEFFGAIGITMNPVDLDYAGFNAMYYGRTFKDERDALFGFTTTSPSATGYFYDNVHSQSAKAYHAVNDPQIDEWAEQQRSEVDPQARKEILRKIWDRTLDQVYRIEHPKDFSTTVLQPWTRYYRFNGPYIGMQSYYEFGIGFYNAWLDK